MMFFSRKRKRAAHHYIKKVKWYFVQVDCKANDRNKTGLAQAQPMTALGPDLGGGNQAREKPGQPETISTIIFLLENSGRAIQTQDKNTTPTLPRAVNGHGF